MKRTKKGKKVSPDRAQAIFKSIKGAIVGLIFSVICVLLFALIVQQTDISAQAISAANQIIKVCAIFLAAFIASRNLVNFRIIAGAAGAGACVVLGYLAFSLVEGEFGDIVVMFADFAMALAIGSVTAAIFSKLAKSTPVTNKR